MLLKVGELARRTGMTVRMLHHYDAIGVLVPSSRTDGGYRLYNRDDVARLHAIQALRQIGLPLNEITTLLAGKPEPVSLIIQRQVIALEHQIAQAGELCARLRLLQSRLDEGDEPDMADWLTMLASMATTGKYFTASEIKKIADNWKLTEDRWQPLIAAIRDAMRRKIAPESMEIQPLARRWMDLSVQWMQGDFELMERWQKMYLQEPAAKGKHGVEVEVVHYINKAIDLRLVALRRYLSQDELQSLNVELEEEWALLAEQIKRLLQKNAALHGRGVQGAVEQWKGLVDRTVNHDPALRQKFLGAFENDPVLRAGSILGPRLETFMREAWIAGSKPKQVST